MEVAIFTAARPGCADVRCPGASKENRLERQPGCIRERQATYDGNQARLDFTIIDRASR